ncbi:MAG TPA: hypothetical protein ENJ13_07330 [Chromatiales bacterium]|nr:hypothetical protein [Chromatiales bacterium]
MTKDYKAPSGRNATRKKTAAKKQAGIGWGSLVMGMVIGLVIGLSFYLYTQLNQPPAEVATAAVTSNSQPAITTSQPEQVERAPEKSRFDFYTLLPEMEIFIPEPDEEAALRMPKLKKPGTYVLQVGSFRHYADADALKAQLALKGFESSIQTVTIDNNNTWHRVRIGPIKEMKVLNRTRSQLRKNNLDFMLLKIKSD